MSYAVFVVLAPFALAVLVWIGRVAWQRRSAPGAPALAVVAGTGSTWLLCSLGEVVAPTAGLSAASAWAAYLPIPWMPIAWLVFALEFTGQTGALRTPAVRAACLVALVTNGLALTMPFHGLLWAKAEPVQVGTFRDNLVTYGPWFWVVALTSWGAVVSGSAVILRAYAGSFRTYQRLSLWLVVGAVIPLVVNALFVFRLVPVDKDFSAISFALGAAALAQGVFRYRFLDLRPTARSVLVESMTEGLVVLDAQGRVTDYNPALGRLAGSTIGLGDPLVTALPALAQALDASEGEATLGGVDGPRHFEWRASPLGPPSRPLGRLVLLRDVTGRRAAEAALRAALDEVQARNEDLDAFAHTVAHDLKNPIHTVRGYAELMHEEGDTLSADLRDEGIDVILRTADKMNDIVHELLLLAGVRNQTVTPTPLDTGAVVAEALDRLEPFLREHGAAVEVPDEWPCALGYGPWIEEVWTNYLTNAAKYGGRPPHIALGADPSAGPDGQHVRFWVRDNGVGLAPEAQAAVFTPFTRLHESRAEGHGLGLSVVVRVLDKLGGTYGVESSPGEGSEFWFTLPAAPLAQSPPMGGACELEWLGQAFPA